MVAPCQGGHRAEVRGAGAVIKDAHVAVKVCMRVFVVIAVRENHRECSSLICAHFVRRITAAYWRAEDLAERSEMKQLLHIVLERMANNSVDND